MNSKTAIKLPSELLKYSKSHVEYWKAEDRLFQQHGNPDYCCRFSHKGKRGFFPLNTPNKIEASKRAAERYRYVVAHGWEAAEKNPEFRVQPPEQKQRILTVGEWIKEVRAVSLVRPITLLSYEQALRRLVAGAVLEINHTVKGHDKWAAEVDAVPLANLTGNSVARWIKTRIAEADGGPKAQETATHTVNHILRSAKALFSTKRVLPKLDEHTRALLPKPVPLSDVGLQPEDTSARFTPCVDPEKLLIKARDELGSTHQKNEPQESFELREQQWIAFLLSFCAGLRRKESDLLGWKQMQLGHADGPRIQLEVTEYFSPKNIAHAKAIPLEPEVAAILERYRGKHRSDDFVLQSDREVNLKGIGNPRCHKTWQALKKWLKAKGVEDRKPVHALRKSVGALMAKRHGIHAAQRLLRHTTPTITSRYYSDSEARETPGIGSLLSGNNKSEVKRGKKPRP